MDRAAGCVSPGAEENNNNPDHNLDRLTIYHCDTRHAVVGTERNLRCGGEQAAREWLNWWRPSDLPIAKLKLKTWPGSLGIPCTGTCGLGAR
jgi:hypothetical protein